MFASSAAQPRYHRRVEALLALGLRVTVYAFSRGLYEQNTFPSETTFVSLGPMPNGRYASRLLRLCRAAARVRKMEHRLEEPGLIYCFGLDMFLLAAACFSGRVPLVYEIGDLRSEAVSKSRLSRPVALLENWCLERASLVVVTSSRFIDVLNSGRRGRQPPEAGFLVIENRVPTSVADSRPTLRSADGHRRIRVGFVGLLRYQGPLVALLRAIERRSDRYELHVYGDGPVRNTLESLATGSENVFFYGPFRNPDDLARIYNEIDISHVVYDNSDLNVRLAIPNKFFESLYFGVPLIVASNTELAQRVEAARVGFVVDPSESASIGALLDSLDINVLNAAAARALSVPQTDILIDGRSFSDRVTTILRSQPSPSW